jgi:hypothetical protein
VLRVAVGRCDRVGLGASVEDVKGAVGRENLGAVVAFAVVA